MAWTPDTVVMLIECVKGNPSLYSVEDRNYKNKAVRMSILMQIAEEISVKRPGTTPAEVRKKWNIIRATYMSERRKMLDSCKSGVGTGQVYVPSLYYYNCMDFLSSSLQVRMSQDSLNEFHASSLDYERDESERDSCDIILQDEDIPAPEVVSVVESESPPVSVTPPVSVSPPLRKRRKAEHDEIRNALKTATSVLCGISATPPPPPPPPPPPEAPKDPLDIFGMHVANKLRTLNAGQIPSVMHEIDCVIHIAFLNK